MKRILLLGILISFALPLSAETLYKETRTLFFDGPTQSSIFSPSGTYYLNALSQNQFEIRRSESGNFAFRSKYYAYTPPFPTAKEKGLSFYVFSPDEKQLLVDRYWFPDSNPVPKRWIEVWDVEMGRLNRFIHLDKFDWPKGTTLSYNLRSALSQYYSGKSFKAYARGAQLVFSSDGSLIFSLYPTVKVFRYPSLEEITGEFNYPFMGGGIYKNIIPSYQAPVIANSSGKNLIFSTNDTVYLYPDFFSNQLERHRMGFSAQHIEWNGDQSAAFVNGQYYQVRFWTTTASVGGFAYLSKSGNRILSNQSLYNVGPTLEPQLPLYPEGNGSIIPSSDRSLLFIHNGLTQNLLIHDFDSGRLLQTIEVRGDEFLLRNTDDGRRLFFRESHSGKVRIFDRVN